MEKLIIDKPDLTIEDVTAVARDRAPVDFSPEAVERIRLARRLVEKWVAEDRVIYGVTTGFGALSHTRISGDETRELQRNILMSHAAGVGKPLPGEVVGPSWPSASTTSPWAMPGCARRPPGT